MKPLAWLFVLLVLVASGLAQTYYVSPEEPLNLTTTCLHNNVLGALSANMTIYAQNGTNVTPTMAMTSLGNGVFRRSVTFIKPGTYFTKEVCGFAGGLTGEGSDTIIVKEMVTVSALLIGLSILLTWLFIHRNGYRLLAAGLFVAECTLFAYYYAGIVNNAILLLPTIIAVIYLFYEVNSTLFGGKAWV